MELQCQVSTKIIIFTIAKPFISLKDSEYQNEPE